MLLPTRSLSSPTTKTPEKEPPVVALDEGSIAPFSGLLLTPKRAAKLHERIEACEATAELDRKHSAEKLADAENLRLAQVKELLAAVKKAEDAATAAAQRHWYESPELWLGTGVVAGRARSEPAVSKCSPANHSVKCRR